MPLPHDIPVLSCHPPLSPSPSPSRCRKRMEQKHTITEMKRRRTKASISSPSPLPQTEDEVLDRMREFGGLYMGSEPMTSTFMGKYVPHMSPHMSPHMCPHMCPHMSTVPLQIITMTTTMTSHFPRVPLNVIVKLLCTPSP